jgi:hypothetical protein
MNSFLFEITLSIHLFWHRLFHIWCHQYDLHLVLYIIFIFIISVRSGYPQCLQANFGTLRWDKDHTLPVFYSSPFMVTISLVQCCVTSAAETASLNIQEIEQFTLKEWLEQNHFLDLFLSSYMCLNFQIKNNHSPSVRPRVQLCCVYVVSPPHTRKAGHCPLPRDCLFHVARSQLNSIFVGCLFHPQPKDAPCRGDKCLLI